MKKIALLVVLGLIACSTGPAPPQLESPVDGSPLFQSMPFVWHPVPEASNYLIEFAADNAFATLISGLSTQVTDTVFELTEGDYSYFQAGFTYYWRVYSGDSKSWGDPSAPRSFTVAGGGKP